jgi:uncharacterized protein YbaR (Trm112 family)
MVPGRVVHPRRPQAIHPLWKGVLMAISKELLEILICPACKGELELKQDGSGLKCLACKRVYPVRDDIPVMLIDEAKIEE